MKAKESMPLPSHHPAEEYLFDYALGTLPEVWSLAVATHLTFCPNCRAQVAAYEAMGGNAMSTADSVAMAPGSLDRLLAQLDPEESGRDETHRGGLDRTRSEHGRARVAMPASIDGLRLPAPLGPYLPGTAERQPGWRRLMAGLDEIRLPMAGEGQKAVLLRIAAGRSMPRHTHRGDEMTVVLDGGFTDASGAFLRGDCALLDESVDHVPVAMADRPCICLAVTDAPLKLTGPIGRWLNPLVRY